MSEIINCNNCEYFFINPEGITMCNNSRGLPFPNINDYCSYAKSTEVERQFNNSELLKRVYEQRHQ